MPVHNLLIEVFFVALCIIGTNAIAF